MTPRLLSDLHFLRPDWFGLALPAALVVWLILRSEDPARPFKNLIASHLLPHLLVGQGSRFRIRPAHVAAVFLALAILALAGPSWQREAPPFAREKAALVVALDLSRSMDAIDVSPTRLERAKQKVHDLLSLRQGARTALLAYAGSAHTVLPLTDDAEILEVYLEALATNLMPVPGKDAPGALSLAESLLSKEREPGTILFVTDGIAVAQVPAFTAHRGKSSHQVVVLGVGTSEGGPVRDGKGFLTEGGRRVVAKLDKEGLEAMAARAGAFVATATLDDADVTRIQRGIESHLESIVQKDQSARYRDFGWYLAPFLALLGGLWFRRGWTIRWAAALLGAFLLSAPAEAGEWHFADLWATPDQQGRFHFDRGDYKQAGRALPRPDVEGGRVLPGSRLCVRGRRVRASRYARGLVRPRQRLREDEGPGARGRGLRQGARGAPRMARGEGQSRPGVTPHPEAQEGRRGGGGAQSQPQARRGEVRREGQEG